MNEAHFDVYYRRATQMADAMKLCQEDLTAYASAAGLLAVHCAISFSDAVILRLGGDRPKGDNHKEAIVILRRVCRNKKIDDQKGITQFEKLIDAKSGISYGPHAITVEMVFAYCTAAERFQAWSEKTIKSMNMKDR